MDPYHLSRTLDLAVAIQQISAPTFYEARRAAFLCEQFLAEGLFDVSIDPLGNVYGRQPGAGLARPLVISAHTDTVFPESVDLTVTRQDGKISGPGIGDNSLGVAGLFSLLWSLRQRSIALPGDLWLVANVGEEGLGNLRGMRAVVDRFGDHPLAYIVLEGMSLGQIYHRGLDVLRYRITIKTPGGHSWVDYGRPSAVHELAGLVTRLTALPLPNQPRTTLNVGVFSGGTTVNTIAAEASVELDLRSESAEALASLSTQVEALVAACRRQGIRAIAEISGQRPAGAISSMHPLVRLAVRCLQAQGIQSSLNVGSTDANIPLSLGLPAVCLGLSTGCGAHTVGETIHTAPLGQGLSQLTALVEQAWLALS
jgi:acetylornithine deacetylase/succinyl-diaminopimelate desuccinylase-like protein